MPTLKENLTMLPNPKGTMAIADWPHIPSEYKSHAVVIIHTSTKPIVWVNPGDFSHIVEQSQGNKHTFTEQHLYQFLRYCGFSVRLWLSL